MSENASYGTLIALLGISIFIAAQSIENSRRFAALEQKLVAVEQKLKGARK